MDALARLVPCAMTGKRRGMAISSGRTHATRATKSRRGGVLRNFMFSEEKLVKQKNI